jgi:hypothetical protein
MLLKRLETALKAERASGVKRQPTTPNHVSGDVEHKTPATVDDEVEFKQPSAVRSVATKMEDVTVDDDTGWIDRSAARASKANATSPTPTSSRKRARTSLAAGAAARPVETVERPALLLDAGDSSSTAHQLAVVFGEVQSTSAFAKHIVKLEELLADDRRAFMRAFVSLLNQYAQSRALFVFSRAALCRILATTDIGSTQLSRLLRFIVEFGSKVSIRERACFCRGARSHVVVTRSDNRRRINAAVIFRH